MLLGARHPMQSSQPNPDFHPRWFVRGDIDGFFGLALDNLIQVLLISSLWTHVLGFSPARLYDRVLPGIAICSTPGRRTSLPSEAGERMCARCPTESTPCL